MGQAMQAQPAGYAPLLRQGSAGVAAAQMMPEEQQAALYYQQQQQQVAMAQYYQQSQYQQSQYQQYQQYAQQQYQEDYAQYAQHYGQQYLPGQGGQQYQGDMHEDGPLFYREQPPPVPVAIDPSGRPFKASKLAIGWW